MAGVPLVICRAQGKEVAGKLPEYTPWLLVVTVWVKPLPLAHFAVTTPFTMGAPTAATPDTTAAGALLLAAIDEAMEAATELAATEDTLDAIAELTAGALLATTMIALDAALLVSAGTLLAAVLLAGVLLAALLTTAGVLLAAGMLLAAAIELLDTDDDVDFLSSSLHPTNTTDNNMPSSGLIMTLINGFPCATVE